MTAAANLHPPDETLARFLHGRLPIDLQAEIEQHVITCAECCERLERLPADTLAEQVRGVDPGDTSAMPIPRESRVWNLPPELRDHPRYRVIRPLGVGGMGAVFQAEHRRMERMVALKVIHSDLLNHPTALERFHREVKSAAQLSHPNIVAAHDADAAGDVHFLVMEYVDGASLARVVEAKGPLPVAHACHYIRQAALGLQHAFEKGMVHRDIKPQNLMLTKKGQIKVVDFGLACLTRAPEPEAMASPKATLGRGLTETGAVVGTPDYMAPEQIDNARAVDIRADIYALGGTLYFALSGRPPFRAGNAVETMLNQRRATAKPLDEVNRDVPPKLAKVVERMLAKDPAERFQTPAEVATALAQFIKKTPATNDDKPRSRRPRRSAWQIAVVTLVAVMAVVALVVGFRPGPKTNDAAPAPLPVASSAKPVLIVVPQEFYAGDYRPLIEGLRENKLEAKVASSSMAPCRALNGGPPSEIVPDFALPANPPSAKDFSAVVMTGGYIHEFKDDRAARAALWTLLNEMSAARKPIGAIDSGLLVLSAAGQLQGRKVARNPRLSEFDKMKASGATIVDQLVVEDGTLLTASNGDAGAEFARKLAAMVGTTR